MRTLTPIRLPDRRSVRTPSPLRSPRCTLPPRRSEPSRRSVRSPLGADCFCPLGFAVVAGAVVVAAGALVLGVFVSVFCENAGALNNSPAAARLSKTFFMVFPRGVCSPEIELRRFSCVPRILLNDPSAIPTPSIASFQPSSTIRLYPVARYNFIRRLTPAASQRRIAHRATPKGVACVLFKQSCNPYTSAPLNGRKPNSAQIIQARSILFDVPAGLSGSVAKAGKTS